MYHTNAAYKQKVTELPQDYRMEIEVIYDAQVEDLLEPLQCEDSASLETEAGEAFEHSVQSAERITIPPEDIFEAGFSESVFLNTFCVGSSVRANFWVRIFNENGKYRNDALATAEIRPWVTLYDDAGEAVDTVPVGVFYVDQITVQNNDLRLDCFDKMQFMETLFIPQETETSLYAITKRLAATVRADFVTTPQRLVTNSAGRSIISNTVNDSIFKGYSNKQVIECIAEVCGSFAIFNPDGDLELRWFKKADVELRGDWANAALELNGNTFSLDGNVVQVTGVRVVNEDTELAKAGTDDYLLTINENPIAAVMPALAANAVLYRMKGMKYIPCKWCRIGGDPSLQLGDILTVIDNKTEYNEADYDSYDKYPLYMTARSWQFNCGGFSDTYTSAGNAETDLNRDRGMTVSKRISQLAKRVTEAEKNITEGMDDRELALLLFNEKMFNAMGLYKTVLDKDGGGVIIYYHDEEELESSQTIYMFGTSGFAWTTDGWNDGDPLWNYGFTDAGDAILNTINAYIVSADLIKTGYLQSQNGASWINMEDGTFCFGSEAGTALALDENKTLSVYGTLRNIRYPKYSVSIGKSETGSSGALTVTDSAEGYGDIFQVYGVVGGDRKGTVWTAPFLTNAAGTNRKGIAVFPNDISIFNDNYGNNASVTIGKDSEGFDEVHLKNGHAHLGLYRDSISILNTEHDWLWFNYWKPYGGYYVNSYHFGSGYNNTHSTLVAKSYNLGYSADESISFAWVDTNHETHVVCSNVSVGGTVLYNNQIASFHGNVSIGNGYYNGYALSVVGTACVNGVNVTSDPDLKENITEVADLNALNKISAMKFYSYDYKNQDSSHIDIGTMAPDAPTEIQSNDGKAIDLYAYINLTTKAVQELSAKVEQQEKEIAELKAVIEELKQ